MGLFNSIKDGFNILGAIGGLNPATSQIASTMGLLGRIPQEIQQVLLGSLTEEMLQKLATWSTTFIDEVNKLPECNPVNLRRLVDPHLDSDYFATMAQAGLDVPLLDAADLATINNTMTKAIKAENWKEAIGVALSIAGNIVPVK